MKDAYISRDDIERHADVVRIQAGQLAVPVKPVLIAKSLNFEVNFVAFTDELSGVLVRESGKCVIAINANHSPARRSYSLSHEIGHAVLGHTGDFFVDKTFINKRDTKSSMGTDVREIQANQFAASLLMPKALLHKEFTFLVNLNFERRSVIEKMAARFEVSKKAMEYRLVNLALIGPPDDND
jgi:Zn-dependent peptidase ImmA (M78 family)